MKELTQQTERVKILNDLSERINNWSPYVCQELPITTLYTHRILSEFIKDKLKEEKDCLKRIIETI